MLSHCWENAKNPHGILFCGSLYAISTSPACLLFGKKKGHRTLS